MTGGDSNNNSKGSEGVSESTGKTVETISKFFPGAISSDDLIAMIQDNLSKRGYNSDKTMLATSFCCDELNRSLEADLAKVYGGNFNFGGLAGFCFGGTTGFGAMASHIPDNGSCLVVYGPHVGVDADGKVGTVNRRGCVFGGTCCGSGAAAATYVLKVHEGSIEAAEPTKDLVEAQQSFVMNTLLPYAKRLSEAPELHAELPFVLFEEQDKLMEKLISKGMASVASGKLALLGGIQINTPPGIAEYFLPLRFEVREKDDVVESLIARSP